WFNGVGVTVQSLTADGALDGDPVRIAGGTATGEPRIVAGGSNQFVVVWPDNRTGVPDIFAQRIRTQDPSSAPETTGGVRWISCAPNPVIESTSVRFAMSEASRAMVEIVAPNGRVVRTIRSEAYGSGEHFVEWDRTDDSGNRVGSGVYFLRMRGERETVRGPKLIVIR